MSLTTQASGVWASVLRMRPSWHTWRTSLMVLSVDLWRNSKMMEIKRKVLWKNYSKMAELFSNQRQQISLHVHKGKANNGNLITLVIYCYATYSKQSLERQKKDVLQPVLSIVHHYLLNKKFPDVEWHNILQFNWMFIDIYLHRVDRNASCIYSSVCPERS